MAVRNNRFQGTSRLWVACFFLLIELGTKSMISAQVSTIDSMKTPANFSETINITGIPIHKTGLYEPSVGWGKYEITNLTDHQVKVVLTSVVCRIGEDTTVFSDWGISFTKPDFLNIPDSAFFLEPAQTIEFMVGFKTIYPRNVLQLNSVDIELICEEATYLASCPVTLTIRHRKRD